MHLQIQICADEYTVPFQVEKIVSYRSCCRRLILNLSGEEQPYFCSRPGIVDTVFMYAMTARICSSSIASFSNSPSSSPVSFV
jgi:hypothetical protein